MTDQDKLDKKSESVPPDYYEKGLRDNFFQRIWHKKRFKEVLDLIEPKRVRYLDVGCNGGLLMAKVAEKLEAVEIFGLDVSKESIEYVKNKYPKFMVQVADCTSLPFTDDFFDLITCFEVLEHLEDPLKAIAEIKRCLKKRGEAILLIPTNSLLFRFIWYFWTRFGRGRVWYKKHINRIKASELKKILENMDFEIIKIKTSHLGMLKAIKARLKG